jgi:hypothetical protein
MPPSKRKPAQVARPSAAVFLYEQLVHMQADDDRFPGPDTAAVLAAQQSGRVVVGAPYVERKVEAAGSVLVVWAVPVEAV